MTDSSRDANQWQRTVLSRFGAFNGTNAPVAAPRLRDQIRRQTASIQKRSIYSLIAMLQMRSAESVQSLRTTNQTPCPFFFFACLRPDRTWTVKSTIFSAARPSPVGSTLRSKPASRARTARTATVKARIQEVVPTGKMAAPHRHP
jgi:hypothetical protein